jgi:nitrogen fixation protein NifZ
MGLIKQDPLELDNPPIFEMEEKVRLRKMVRNDGTFPGIDIGVTLAKKGQEGYVVSIGTYLQSYYIYAVHFIESGLVIGCRSKELERATDNSATINQSPNLGDPA